MNSRIAKSNITRAGWLEIKTDGSWNRCWTVFNNQKILCYPDDTVSFLKLIYFYELLFFLFMFSIEER